MKKKPELRLEDVCKKHEKRFIAIARLYHHDPHTIEDVLQQTALKLMKHFHKLDPNNEAKTRSYVCETCRSVAADICRKNKRVFPVDFDNFDVASEQYNPERLATGNINMEQIINAVYNLEYPYREILIEKIEYNRSTKEIAEMLSSNPERVKKQLARARDLVAKAIEKGEIL